MYIDANLVMPANHPEAQRLMKCLTRDNPAYKTALKYAPGQAHKISPTLKLYEIRDGMAIIPRYWVNDLDEITRYEIEDRTYASINVYNLGRPIRLRDYQAEPTVELVTKLALEYGVVLNALMGTGKTVVALEVARRLHQKTVVLVHTEFLMNQWVDRIKEFLGVDAGIIQGDRCELDRPIVIAMMQTLHARAEQYAHVFENVFGLVITDEVHRAAAPVFSSVIRRFNARYRLGVSGTVQRADDLQWVFFSHIGGPDVTMERSAEYKIEPVVTMYEAPYLGIPAKLFKHPYTKNFQQAKFLNAIADSDTRNRFIVHHLEKQMAAGRKIIVFSERRQHLVTLYERLLQKYIDRDELDGFTAGYIVGGMKQEDRDFSAKQQVIFCTFQLASEALDIPELDCAFLCTPKSNVQQAVGRIERALEGKPTPLVYDFVDRHYGVAKSQANKRVDYYVTRGWQVSKKLL